MVVGVVLLSLGLAGCSDRPKATLIGGKPLSHWLAELHDKDVKKRKAAATHVGDVCASDPTAMSALIEALKDPDPGVRCEVLVALTRSGHAASEAAPKIAEMQQKDSNEQVRKFAAKALEKIR
jgi:HEAT repeat protein